MGNEINSTTANALKTGGDIAGSTGNPIGAVVDLLVGLGVGTYTAKQQAKLQEKLGMLTLEEQAKLNAQLLKTQDKQAKIALIENAIKEKEKTKRLPIYIGVGLLVLVLGIGTFVYIRKKK